ncbi:MAG: methylenetetrahydrofolate reductase [NAD(P)H] [Planctomycetes bacterium]|nr:methylenetetrahydrofolate reductase [NAD(P)H] [Planctomycetota bacterium]
MRIGHFGRKKGISVSFEFFPPKTEKGWEELFQAVARLVPLHPSFVSVTYGAGGSTRTRTHDLVVRIQRETGIPVVAHLTCVGSNRDEVRAIVHEYVAAGIHNILALRGDLPAGASESDAFLADGFRHAVDLVRFLKQEFPQVSIGVAGFPEGHPRTPNRLREMDYLKAKIDAGADYMITQLFFDNHDFYDFQARCELAGIDVPIMAGVMPIISRRNLERMADLAAGTRFPAGLLRSIRRAHDDESVRHVGVHWATEQVRDLIDNQVAGIHFYTLNRSRASEDICKTLGLKHYLDLDA